MADPATPKKQVSPATLAQQPTPPATQRGVVKVIFHVSKSETSIPRLSYDKPITSGNTEEFEDEDDQPTSPVSSQSEHDHAEQVQEPTENDIREWMKSSENQQQRKRRFDSLLHSFWPSNDQFNAARHQDYDHEEHGWYDDFIRDQWEDGKYPFDDDNYNPLKDPSKSTEVWEPQIGEEGIENQYDLYMVLKARQNHRALSKAHRQFRAQGGYAMLISNESTSGTNHDDKAGKKDLDSKVGMETLSAVKNVSMIQPTAVSGTPESKKHRRRRSRKTTKSKKRKRDANENPDRTYKYSSGSEYELPIRKRGKKNQTDASNDNWKAQTRAAARCQSCMGLDGNYDTDNDEFYSC
ncbi:hypothetical protein F5B22DRAFT_642197 [Xylaria bambusicola]|uniref:uncharacterized protein n=1 Tax=Xylaria bambusicola TaxID=326684 RepID=UPI0020078518|nr:uncharacterized protein F5B22DRAFT_642197 [Xylaria bambusicola]KAI0526041.1 hypothetical protein F5B22DRAFT_642197 [Xylaria bambusicola]